jgi:hypothetical protein
MKNLILLSVAAVFLTGIISCSGKPEKGLSFKKDGDIWFRNSDIRLRFDKNMYCTVYYQNDENTLNDVTAGDLARPSHFIVVNGREVKDFAVDYDKIKSEDIETAYGAGKRLTLTGVAEIPGGGLIRKTLYTEIYDKYPDV